MAVESTGLSVLVNAPLVSQNATATAIARGTRVTLDSSQVVSAAASTVRGDFIAAGPVAASGTGAFVPLQSGAIVPVLTDGVSAIAVGDTIYSAAAGRVGKVSTSTVILGKAVTAAISTAQVADGPLFEVLLTNPL